MKQEVEISGVQLTERLHVPGPAVTVKLTRAQVERALEELNSPWVPQQGEKFSIKGRFASEVFLAVQSDRVTSLYNNSDKDFPVAAVNLGTGQVIRLDLGVGFIPVTS